MTEPVSALLPDEARVDQARRLLTQAFLQAGLDDAAQEARLLVGHAAGLSHSDLIMAANDILPRAALKTLERYASERLYRRRPVSDILGYKEFWKDRFIISEEVLTPRPETEGIIEAALDIFSPDQALKILDLGTGSGAILLSLLREFPRASGTGVDISPAALEIARRNAMILQRDCQFLAGSWLAPIGSQFDLIVSNPPYISDAEMRALSPEVSAYDPDIALRGGVDGLDPYALILKAINAQNTLRPNGAIIFEVGHKQSGAVAALISAQGLTPSRRKDLSGIERIICAQQPAEIDTKK